jgi:hypothetical protein
MSHPCLSWLYQYVFLANHLILLSHLKGMDVDWPYQRRVLGDTLNYNCPPSTMTWKTYATSQQVIIISGLFSRGFLVTLPYNTSAIPKYYAIF